MGRSESYVEYLKVESILSVRCLKIDEKRNSSDEGRFQIKRLIMRVQDYVSNER